MHYPRRLPPIIHPTKCLENDIYQTNVVPHIHPSHTVNQVHNIYKHLHYYPHTESTVSDVAHQHFNCGVGPVPGPVPGPRPFWGR